MGSVVFESLSPYLAPRRFLWPCTSHAEEWRQVVSGFEAKQRHREEDTTLEFTPIVSHSRDSMCHMILGMQVVQSGGHIALQFESLRGHIGCS